MRPNPNLTEGQTLLQAPQMGKQVDVGRRRIEQGGIQIRDHMCPRHQAELQMRGKCDPLDERVLEECGRNIPSQLADEHVQRD